MRSSREPSSVFFWIPAKQGFVRPCLCDEREIYCTVAVKTRDKIDGQRPNIAAKARVRYDKSTATIFPGKQHRRLRQNCCQSKFCPRMRSKLNNWVVVLASRNMSAYGRRKGAGVLAWRENPHTVTSPLMLNGPLCRLLRWPDGVAQFAIGINEIAAQESWPNPHFRNKHII